MWWKTYFWAYTVLMIIGVFGLVESLSKFLIGDWVGLILNISIYIGLYAYVFKKKLLKTIWWTIFFWVNAVTWVLTLLDMFVLAGRIEEMFPFFGSGLGLSSGEVIFSIIVSLPALYAVYKLSTGKK